MRNLKKYLHKKKYILLFLIGLIIFGVIVGGILGFTNINLLKEDVIYYASHIAEPSYNYLFLHFFLIVMSFALSFIGIGVPLLCTILFYEGLTFGFLFSIFTSTYKIGGSIFAVIFCTVTKACYIILLILFFFKILEIARKMIGKYIYKTDPSAQIIHLIKGCICLIILFFINDIIIYFCADKILPLFQFLLP